MTFKFNKRTVILAGGIFIIGLMVIDIFAIGALQGLRPSGSKANLPKEDIVNYELTLDQENELIGQGVTLLKFYHTTNCLNCTEQKTFVEYLINKYKGSFFLEEIQSNKTVDYPTLIISSTQDTVTLEGADYSQVLEKLCDLMPQPPVEFRCAVRNV